MSREEVKKLIGGYATGTLSAAEQEALFAAALDDQELFDAMANEQTLHDLLRDPAVRAELLTALDPPPKSAGFLDWLRPAVRGLAMAGLALVGMVVVALWKHPPLNAPEPSKPALVAEANPPKEMAPPMFGVPPQVAEPATQPADSGVAVSRNTPRRASELRDFHQPSIVSGGVESSKPKGNAEYLGEASPAAPSPLASLPSPAFTKAELDKLVAAPAAAPKSFLQKKEDQAVGAVAFGGPPPPPSARMQAADGAVSTDSVTIEASAVQLSEERTAQMEHRKSVATLPVGAARPAAPAARIAPMPPPAAVANQIAPAADARTVFFSAGAIGGNLSAVRLQAGDTKAPAPQRLAVRISAVAGSTETNVTEPVAAGRSVRLRLLPNADGYVTILEAGRKLASGAVKRSKPFDTSKLSASSGTTKQYLVILDRRQQPTAPVVPPRFESAGLLRTSSAQDRATFVADNSPDVPADRITFVVTLTWK